MISACDQCCLLLCPFQKPTDEFGFALTMVSQWASETLLEFSFVIPATIALTLPNLCLLVFFQGSPEENRFKLLSYGIPIDTLPFTDGAECKVKQHLQWLQTRRKQEQTPLLPGAARVVIPGRFDVLFGRGKPMQEHPGNLVR
jgi:hypothetical protein